MNCQPRASVSSLLTASFFFVFSFVACSPPADRPPVADAGSSGTTGDSGTPVDAGVSLPPDCSLATTQPAPEGLKGGHLDIPLTVGADVEAVTVIQGITGGER